MNCCLGTLNLELTRRRSCILNGELLSEEKGELGSMVLSDVQDTFKVYGTIKEGT